MRTAIIDTGGGLRGIYAAGVLDELMSMGIEFDLGIGVSAGSANVAAFLSRQPGRNYIFYTEYSRRPRYMSVWNYFTKHSYIDLDYVYSTLSNSDGEYPLDYMKMASSPAEFFVVATDAETGEPRYFSKKDIRRDSYDVCKASSSMPFVCRPYEVYGRKYYDGCISDPFPVHVAFDKGCSKVVMLVTSPVTVPRSNRVEAFFAKGIERQYPIAAMKMTAHAEVVNSELERLKKYVREGRLLIVAPDDACGVRVLERRKDRLDKLYMKGRNDASAIPGYLYGTMY